MKSIAVLDKWVTTSAKQGPGKHWLYSKLSNSFNIDIVPPKQNIISNIICLLKSFDINKNKWGVNYYKVREQYKKTPKQFRNQTDFYQKAVQRLCKSPDLIFQIGGLFGPVKMPNIPYISYHDQTVRMVEDAYKDWLPDDFQSFRDEWYQLEAMFYHSVNKVITYSSFTKHSMIGQYGLPPDRVTVIPTACKLSFPSQEEIMRPRKQQLLFVTTNFYMKGGDIVLSAFSEIKKAIPSIKLVIAGGKIPPEIDIVDPAIRYVGVLSPEELSRQYLQSKLLVHPARHDAYPNVLKEAMAFGLPMVASNSCGIPEILGYGKAGIILPSLCPKRLATEVVNLLSNPNRYNELQLSCLLLRENYRPDLIAEKFINLFKSYI